MQIEKEFYNKTKLKPNTSKPRTKETITIPASTVPVFKAGKEFKDRVNK